MRAQFENVPLKAARWVVCDDEVELARFVGENQRRLYRDVAGNYTYVAKSDWAMNYAAEQYPQVQFLKSVEI